MHIPYEPLTDNQWEVIKEFFLIKRKRQLDLQEVFNAILWITRTGSQWSILDTSFLHWTAVYYYVYRWPRQGNTLYLILPLLKLFSYDLKLNLKLG